MDRVYSQNKTCLLISLFSLFRKRLVTFDAIKAFSWILNRQSYNLFFTFSAPSNFLVWDTVNTFLTKCLKCPWWPWSAHHHRSGVPPLRLKISKRLAGESTWGWQLSPAWDSLENSEVPSQCKESPPPLKALSGAQQRALLTAQLNNECTDN